MQKKVSKNILAIPCSVQKYILYTMWYIILDRKGMPQKYKKRGGGKEQGKLCTAKSMYTKKGKEIKTCRNKILTIPRECTKI